MSIQRLAFLEVSIAISGQKEAALYLLSDLQRMERKEIQCGGALYPKSGITN